ncbi:GNAT family N-acetyltransferase [Nostocoides sp. HKS02]|uniref:GNAT family N-acetyltransferase n=1 Tax=Nostocoides sp. HKS02 TaxID=1813880 RepID=UPI0018A81FCF
MAVRPATAADASTLARVAAATFALACPPHVTQESIEAFISTNLSLGSFVGYLADADRDLFLAEDDGEPVGYAMVVAGDPADPDVKAALRHLPTTELSKIYVVPGSHGGAVAAALMVASLDAARDRGAAGVWLGVNQLNERAQRFYTKSGFSRVGTKRFLVGDRYEDDFIYEQRLGSL